MNRQSLTRIPIRANQKIVGDVRGETFYKNLVGSKHFLRIPRAIAFDVSSLDDAERVGAHFVEIRDVESGRVYRASIAKIRAKGFRVARGHGEQVALALGDFTRDDEASSRNPRDSSNLRDAAPEPLATQLDFWSASYE